MLTCLVPVLFTFYIQGVLKLKKNNSGAKGLKAHEGYYNKLWSCVINRVRLYTRHISKHLENFNPSTKGKEIPVQTWTGLDGSSRLKLIDFERFDT